MSMPARDQVEAVLADLIKETLASRKSAHVPGLGTFSVNHRNAVIEREASGGLRMHPPGDEIVFEPESQPA